MFDSDNIWLSKSWYFWLWLCSTKMFLIIKNNHRKTYQQTVNLFDWNFWWKSYGFCVGLHTLTLTLISKPIFDPKLDSYYRPKVLIINLTLKQTLNTSFLEVQSCTAVHVTWSISYCFTYFFPFNYVLLNFFFNFKDLNIQHF
jgi:hypothetical protein